MPLSLRSQPRVLVVSLAAAVFAACSFPDHEFIPADEFEKLKDASAGFGGTGASGGFGGTGGSSGTDAGGGSAGFGGGNVTIEKVEFNVNTGGAPVTRQSGRDRRGCLGLWRR